MIIEYLSQIIGQIPEGYEPIAYVCGVLILLFLLVQFFSFLHSFFRDVI